MNELIKRVKNIQNKAKSLKCGSCMIDDNSIVFAVGHEVYAKKTVYIKVKYLDKSNYAIYHLKEKGEEECLNDKCKDYDDIIIYINRLLKRYFHQEDMMDKDLLNILSLSLKQESNFTI